MRPDNIPDGLQINPERKEVEETRAMILEALWRVLEESESTDKLTPGFSSSSKFIQGTLLEVHMRGPFVPVGKSPPKSDA